MFDPTEQLAIWLEGLDLDQPLSDLIDPEWLEPVTLTIDEVQSLEEQGRELAQELLQRDMIAALPPMDMPEQLLEQIHESTIDFDR